MVNNSSSISFNAAAVQNFVTQKTGQTFWLHHVKRQPFIAFDLKINGKLKKNTKISIQIAKYDKTFMTVEVNGFKEIKQDIHFNTENSWSSELQFLPKNVQQITIKIENAGNKIEDIHFNFFYPNKTEDLEKVESELASKPKSISCSCPIPAYEARADWDPAGTHPAQLAPTTTTVTHLIVHHAAGPNTSSDWAATVRSIWNYHVNSNGWSDIGYNYLIDPNGVIYEGRGDNVLGAHFSGMNGGTMGVCLLGNYEPDAVEDIDPSLAMQNSLIELLSWKECDISADPLLSSFHAASNQVQMHISGHRDAGTGTACPGDNVYDILPNIRNSSSAYIPNCGFAPNADLVVSALETNPNPAIIGENTTIEIAIGNGGNTDVIETLQVAVNIDGVQISTFVFDSIHSGQILHFLEPNYVFTSLGAHQICVYIDSASNETNTANNSYCKTIVVEDSVVLHSDLTAQSISADLNNPIVSDLVNFSFNYKNIGEATSSEAIEGEIIIDGITKQQFTIPEVAVNQNMLKTFAYTFAQPGNHSVCIAISSPTNELNTANNNLCKSFYIAPKSVRILEQNKDILSFEIYPNPSFEKFVLLVDFKQKENVKASLINALGQTVYEKHSSNVARLNENVNVKNLTKGIYTLRIETSKGTRSRKIIVQ